MPSPYDAAPGGYRYCSCGAEYPAGEHPRDGHPATAPDGRACHRADAPDHGAPTMRAHAAAPHVSPRAEASRAARPGAPGVGHVAAIAHPCAPSSDRADAARPPRPSVALDLGDELPDAPPDAAALASDLRERAFELAAEAGRAAFDAARLAGAVFLGVLSDTDEAAVREVARWALYAGDVLAAHATDPLARAAMRQHGEVAASALRALAQLADEQAAAHDEAVAEGTR